MDAIREAANTEKIGDEEIVDQQPLVQSAQIPVLRMAAGRHVLLCSISQGRFDHLPGLALQVLPSLQGEQAKVVDHLALLVHHVVVLQQPLSGFEVLQLHPLLRPLDRLRDHRVRQHLPFFCPELVQ